MTSSNRNMTMPRSNSTTVEAMKKAANDRQDNLIAGYTYIVLSLIGCAGSLICFLAIFTLRSRGNNNKTLSSVQPIFISFCVSSLFSASSAHSRLTHATLAFHRFFAIVLANRFVWLRSRACTAILVAVPWLFLGIIGVLPFFHVGVVYGYNPTLDRCFITRVNSWAYIQFNKVFFIVFSLASIAFCYTSIAVKVGMTRRRAIGVVEMSSRRDDSGGIPGRMEPTNIKQQNKKGAGVTKTVIALCLLFVISFLPWMIYPLVAKTDVALNTPQGLTVVTLYLFGCAASPWLIVLLTPALRNHVNRQFHRIGSSVDASWALQQRH